MTERYEGESADDELFLAITKLNNPECYDATAAGLNHCPCVRCGRLRKLLADKVDPQPDEGRATKLDETAELRTYFARMFGVPEANIHIDGDTVRVEKPDTAEVQFNEDAFAEFLSDVEEEETTALGAEIEANRSSMSALRKATPIATGVVAYFPRALAQVAKVSAEGNKKHNPGEPLHWAREKSVDEADALQRHLLDFLAGEDFDDEDGMPHLAKVAWRALALLQRWCDGEDVRHP